SLRLTELLLEDLDIPTDQARRAIELFRKHDEKILTESYEFANDERRIIQTTQEASKELLDLFESDRTN
ncbi:MAG: glutathione-regulated potassium-efflux system protein KefB, partial [Acidocella sp.]|nr:glutathione-regulated potassium-efflux system protein KefB [Acidocella sp.]